VAGRLEARLSGGTLRTLAPEAALLLEQSLTALVPVLTALGRTISLAVDAKSALSDKEAA
jgi:hypothetical protein